VGFSGLFGPVASPALIICSQLDRLHVGCREGVSCLKLVVSTGAAMRFGAFAGTGSVGPIGTFGVTSAVPDPGEGPFSVLRPSFLADAPLEMGACAFVRICRALDAGLNENANAKQNVRAVRKQGFPTLCKSNPLIPPAGTDAGFIYYKRCAESYPLWRSIALLEQKIRVAQAGTRGG